MKLITHELLTRLEGVQLPSRRRMKFPQRGEKTSVRKGSSIEFSDYREYLQGDDIRSIDWNVYARTERLFLKLFLEEESKPVYFVVDGSRSMNFGTPTKFEYALALAASLSYVSLRRYDRPHILILQDDSFRRFTFHSRREFFPVLQQIEKSLPAGETHLSQGLRKIALARFPRGVYFILSDFYSYDGFDGLKILGALGNEIHCLQLLTPEESHPPFRGDLRLIDSETADPADVSISPSLLQRYLNRLHSLQDSLKQAAHHSAASYYTISNSTPLPDVILRELRSTGVVA